MRSRIFAALLGLGVGVTSWASMAQTYPSKVITMIVAFSAGGPTDVVARITAQALTERLGQNVVIANLVGAGGVVGTEAAARARPDGYTLYLGVNSMAIFPNVRPPNSPLNFSPERDFVPIGGIAESAHVVVAHKSVGVRSIAELVALAKQKPGVLTYGSAGVGGTSHLPIALFAHAAGIDMLHIPYRGAAQALQDTIIGTVSLSAPGYTGALNDPIKEGTLVPLAVTSAQRLPFLPDVPTLSESGYPDMAFPIWYGVFAPTGTPQPIVDRLSAELKEVAKEPEFIKKMYAQGNHAAYVPPEILAKTLSDGTRSLGERLKTSGINVVE